MTRPSPELLARLERLQLGTRRRLAGLYAGEHRSRRHGSSPDFADHREYHPGDDFRRVDYNLYARLDVLLIKLFEASDELHLRLLIDTSGSMRDKLDAATLLAGAIGFVSLVNRDPVSVHTFPARGAAPRFTSREQGGALFDHLDSLRAEGRTPFASAAMHLLSRPGPAGLTVLVSDLLTPDWQRGLRRLPSRGGDLAVVHVLAPDDLEPDVLGDVDLVDREDRSRLPVSLSEDALRHYRTRAASWTDSVATACRRAGAAYVRFRTTDDPEAALFAGWRTAGVLR